MTVHAYSVDCIHFYKQGHSHNLHKKNWYTVPRFFLFFSLRHERSFEPGDAAVYLRSDNMKKISKSLSVLLFITIFGLMTSCTKDKEATITGSWKCSYSYTYSEPEGTPTMKENKYKGEIMTLSEDGKVFINDRERGSYTFTSSTIIFDCDRMVDGFYNTTLTYSKLKLQQLNRDNEIDEWCDKFEFEKI